jgi:hypothetical protein
MLRWIRRHGETVVVAGITALVVSGAPALAHVTTKLGHMLKHLNPMFVNVGEKASDADLLDGRDSTAFLGASGKAADAELLDGNDSNDFIRVGETAADSELLDGMDSTAFLGATDKAADSDLLDGLNSSAFQRSFNRIVVVRTAAELLSAVDTATLGTLIKLEPGTYNVGSNVLDVPGGVDLEGSGELQTFIVGPGSADATAATLIAEGDSELRFLSVINLGGQPYATAIRANGRPDLTHVRAGAQSGSTSTIAINGVTGAAQNQLQLRNVTALATGAAAAPAYGLFGGGVFSFGVRASTIQAVAGSGGSAYGLSAAGGIHFVEDSVVSGDTDAVNGNARIASTRLEGGVVPGAVCAGVWDGAFTFFASTCPV